MAGRSATKLRTWILALLIFLGYGAVGYRLYDLHVVRSPQLQAEIHNSRYRIITQSPRRGDIFDVRGELLATSQTLYDIGVDPRLAKPEDLPKLSPLAYLLDLPLTDVEKAFNVVNGHYASDPANSLERWRLLKKRVDEEKLKQIKALEIDCVYGNSEYTRVYPKREFAAHIVGYVRQDGQAVYGIEREYDFYLQGQRGWKESEVGGSRGEMAQFRRRQVAAIDGMDVALTLDAYVQSAIEEELRDIAERLKPESASIIVSDPYTGAILGLANFPTYDPNNYNSYPFASLKNRALTDPVEPGSTFKIVAASAALEEKLVNIGTMIDCSQETIVMPNGYVARLPRDSHPLGILSVAEVVAKSSNRGAAHLGVMLGEDSFYEYTRSFGFGEETGLDLGQESIGILSPVKRWDGLTLTRIAMGHAIAATPLQIHFAMATVANGGVLMKPQIVSRIIDADGRPAIEFGPAPKRRVISRETAQTITGLLERVVSTEGTARVAAIPGYRIAGKTGTSQKIVDGRYSSREHVGSFTGFFPADAPEVVITVIVDGAKTSSVAYGSTVAAPSFKKIALKIIPRYAIAPSDDRPAIALGGNPRRLGAGN